MLCDNWNRRVLHSLRTVPHKPQALPRAGHRREGPEKEREPRGARLPAGRVTAHLGRGTLGWVPALQHHTTS